MLAGAGELLALDSRATNPSVLSGILRVQTILLVYLAAHG